MHYSIYFPPCASNVIQWFGVSFVLFLVRECQAKEDGTHGANHGHKTQTFANRTTTKLIYFHIPTFLTFLNHGFQVEGVTNVSYNFSGTPHEGNIL